MAKRSLRGQIAIRKNRILIVHPATDPVIRWCAVCGCDSSMVVPENAARCWGVNVRTVYQRVEAGTVHFLEVPGGVLICLNSIKT